MVDTAVNVSGISRSSLVGAALPYPLWWPPKDLTWNHLGLLGDCCAPLKILTFTTGKIFDQPILGIGHGKDNFLLVFGQSPNEEVQPGHLPVLQAGTHNTFLDIALGTGIPGLLLFVWLLHRIAFSAITAFQKTDVTLDTAVSLGVGVSVIGMAVRLCFDHMLIGTLAVLFWILVAMAMLAPSTADRTQAQRV